MRLQKIGNDSNALALRDDGTVTRWCSDGTVFPASDSTAVQDPGRRRRADGCTGWARRPCCVAGSVGRQMRCRTRCQIAWASSVNAAATRSGRGVSVASS
jgi:hypothetical protein